MLKTLHLEKFQGHVDSTIEFVDGINVILGRSRAGKTAILRGLIWLMTNRPRGNKYHSRFAKPNEPSLVMCEFDNGEIEFKSSPKGRPVYIHGSDLYEPGSSVPEEILEFLNLSPITNIQNQLEAPFLITAKPSEVASVVNKIMHMEKAQDWSRELGSEHRQLKNKAESLEYDMKGLKEFIAKGDEIETIKKEIEEFEVLSERLNELSDKRRYLLNTIDTINDLEKEIEEICEIPNEVVPLIDEYIGLERELSILHGERVDLRNFIEANDEFERCQMNEKDSRTALAERMKDFGNCPFCFSSLDNKAIEYVIKQL